MARYLFLAGFPTLACCALAGCGDGPRMAQVSGTVKVDGKPVELGAIQFAPVDGKSQSTGGEIKNGQYSVQVPLGGMKVSISAPKVIGQKALYPGPNSPTAPIRVEGLPAKFNEQTTLQIEVIRGGVQKDFDLQSK